MKKLICVVPALEKNNYSHHGDLIDWGGTTLIEWKLSQVLRVKNLEKIVVTTPSRKIKFLVSKYGVVRGLHLQKAPYAQAKLIRVVQGQIYDVAVDLRADSSAYGEWFGIELSADNQTQLFLPKGFAHGYSVLSEHAIVQYKVDASYNPQAESGIRFDDPDMGIDWQIDNLKLSDKDQKLPFLKLFKP